MCSLSQALARCSYGRTARAVASLGLQVATAKAKALFPPPASWTYAEVSCSHTYFRPPHRVDRVGCTSVASVAKARRCAFCIFFCTFGRACVQLTYVRTPACRGCVSGTKGHAVLHTYVRTYVKSVRARVLDLQPFTLARFGAYEHQR